MIKMHGTENTFYLIDLMKDHMSEDAMKTKTIDLCQDGSDGVLFVCPSDKHLAQMRIFNADGSEPEMCGNGLRCLARYVLEKYDMDYAVIETMQAAYEVALVDNFHGIQGVMIKLYPVKQMKHAQLEDFKTNYNFTYYNVTNPHIVAYVDEHLKRDVLIEVGEHANSHFDEGMNVNMVRVIDDRSIYVQTYERGVGITKSCGTGMTSSSVHFALSHDKMDQVIRVYNDGGMIECKVEKPDDYSVWFTGNATYISKHDDSGQWLEDYQEQDLYEEFFKITRNSL